ncbi:hypothetical protein LINPERHAP1_LOCUS35786 [Linum perenne]
MFEWVVFERFQFSIFVIPRHFLHGWDELSLLFPSSCPNLFPPLHHTPNKHCDSASPQLTQDKCGWWDDNPGRSTIALVMRDSSTTSLLASESCLGKVSYREILIQ